MNKTRGIALFSVMVMTGLLLLLLGAFMRLNQQHFGLVNNDQSHLAAQEAARSLLDYCTYRLEHHRQWGRTPFNGSVDAGTAGLLEVREIRNTHRLEGRVVQSDVAFKVTLLNNIDGTAEADGVPAGFCRVHIEAWRGTALVRREAMLGTAPLFDAAVISSEQILVDSQTLAVASTDPLRNRLRSKGDIRVPTYEGQFTFNAPSDATERGVLWARSGINMGSHDLTDADEAARAVRATGGRFLPQADTHYEVYDLQIDEVRAPENSVNIQPGVYIFNRQTVSYESDDGPRNVVVPVLQRRDWAVNDEGYVEGGDLREAWYLTSSLPDDAESEWVGLYGDLPEEGLHPMTTNTFTLDLGVQVHFNSLDPDFTGTASPPALVLNSDVNLNVNGDFGVASWDADYNPTIMFRDPETGEVGVDSRGRVVSGSITAHSTGDRPGSIMIEGAILGNGKLLADGDVTLKNTYAAVSSDEASDLSIFAGGSVNIRPKLAASFDEATIFEGGLEDRDASTAFRGLIYAKQDVIIDAETGDRRADVYVEGAVVAREGKVHVRDARNVMFKYNPDFLDTILTPRVGDRVRLERAVWKEL